MNECVSETLARTCDNLYGLAISLAYPGGEEADIFLVQIISTCLRGVSGKVGRGGGQHPVSEPLWAKLGGGRGYSQVGVSVDEGVAPSGLQPHAPPSPTYL